MTPGGQFGLSPDISGLPIARETASRGPRFATTATTTEGEGGAHTEHNDRDTPGDEATSPYLIHLAEHLRVDDGVIERERDLEYAEHRAEERRLTRRSGRAAFVPPEGRRKEPARART